MTESKKIVEELLKVGVFVNDIYDLVNHNKPYPAAIPVLLNVLKEGIQDSKIKEGVIRALAVKEAKGIAGPILIAEYKKSNKNEWTLRWAIGNTVEVTMTAQDVDSICEIVLDKENGTSRQMFVAALGKAKLETSGKAEDVLIQLLDDNDVTLHALGALGKLKSVKAKEKIKMLTNHHNSVIRKEAEKALKKIP